MAWQKSADIRLANLRWLIERHGGEEVCERLAISRQYLHQLAGRTPTRNIGNNLARRIENAFKLEAGWIDSAHTEKESELQRLMNEASGLTVKQIAALLQIAQTLGAGGGDSQNTQGPSKKKR